MLPEDSLGMAVKSSGRESRQGSTMPQDPPMVELTHSPRFRGQAQLPVSDYTEV